MKTNNRWLLAATGILMICILFIACNKEIQAVHLVVLQVNRNYQSI
ncbi:MAG: hypothetical protein ABJB86_05415 [Bacteroidota bacterium]